MRYFQRLAIATSIVAAAFSAGCQTSPNKTPDRTPVTLEDILPDGVGKSYNDGHLWIINNPGPGDNPEATLVPISGHYDYWERSAGGDKEIPESEFLKIWHGKYD